MNFLCACRAYVHVNYPTTVVFWGIFSGCLRAAPKRMVAERRHPYRVCPAAAAAIALNKKRAENVFVNFPHCRTINDYKNVPTYRIYINVIDGGVQRVMKGNRQLQLEFTPPWKWLMIKLIFIEWDFASFSFSNWDNKKYVYFCILWNIQIVVA